MVYIFKFFEISYDFVFCILENSFPRRGLRRLCGPQCTCNVLSPLSHGNIISSFCFLMLIPTNFDSFHTILPQELFFTFSGRAEQIFNCEIQNPGNFFSSGKFQWQHCSWLSQSATKGVKKILDVFEKKYWLLGYLVIIEETPKTPEISRKKDPKGSYSGYSGYSVLVPYLTTSAAVG